MAKEGMAEVEVTEADTEDRTNSMEMENPLWRPQMGNAERRRSMRSVFLQLFVSAFSGYDSY